MTWGRIGAIAVALLLFAGVASAGSGDIIVESPAQDKVYTDNNYIGLNASIADNSNATFAHYEVRDRKSGDILVEGTADGTAFDTGPVEIRDGHHMFVVTAENDSAVFEKRVNFTVDTKGPTVTGRSPDGRTFDRYPTLEITYEDAVSSVDNESVDVWLDGDDVTDAGQATPTGFTLDLKELDIAEGEHDVSIQANDEHGTAMAPKTWTFDIPKKPVLSGNGPTGIVEDADVTLTLTAEDPSGIDTAESELKLVRNDGKVVEKAGFDEVDSTDTDNGVTVTHTLDDLDDGHYTVQADVLDGEQHVTELSWEFTVDTTPPTVDLQSHVDGDIIKDDQTFTTEASDSISGVDYVMVEIGDTRERTTQSSGDQYHIDLDTETVSDGEQDLTVYAYDKAGNRKTQEMTVTVDNTAPTIRRVTRYPDILTSTAEITATVSDAATGVESASYMVRGMDVDGMLSTADGVFDEPPHDVSGTLDADDLADGNYTLSVVAEDGAGHKQVSNHDLVVDTSLDYALDVRELDPVVLQVTQSEKVKVKVRNRGDADDRVTLSTDSPLVTEITPNDRKVRSGETRAFHVTLTPDNVDTGEHTVDLTASGLTTAATGSVTVRVQPSPDRQQEIEQELQGLQATYDELNREREQYTGAVDENEETFDKTAALLANISDMIDNGRYHAASQQLDEARAHVEETDATVTGMATTYQRKQTVSTVLKLLVVLLLSGGVAAFYLLEPPETEEGFNTDDGFIYDVDDRHPLHQKADELQQQARNRIQQVIDRGRETEQADDSESASPQVDGWNGFDSN